MLIGDVARHSGISSRMLRHYDALGLVRPSGRTAGGYREYSTEDVRRIFHVESLRSLGLSLRQIGRVLDDPGFAPGALVGDLIRDTRARLERDRELLERLRAIDTAAPTDWPGVLRTVELMQGLHSTNASRRQQAALAEAEDGGVSLEQLAAAVLAEDDPHVAGALRWALARSGGDRVAALAAGAVAPEAEVRRRAVLAIATMPDAPGAQAALQDALGDRDVAVRRPAALALGRCGVVAAVPVLVDMIVAGVNDVEAAEVLGAVARDDESADQAATALTAALAASTATSPARARLTQALVELPGTLAREALTTLRYDDDRVVALIASVYGPAVHQSREDQTE